MSALEADILLEASDALEVEAVRRGLELLGDAADETADLTWDDLATDAELAAERARLDPAEQALDDAIALAESLVYDQADADEHHADETLADETFADGELLGSDERYADETLADGELLGSDEYHADETLADGELLGSDEHHADETLADGELLGADDEAAVDEELDAIDDESAVDEKPAALDDESAVGEQLDALDDEPAPAQSEVAVEPFARYYEQISRAREPAAGDRLEVEVALADAEAAAFLDEIHQTPALDEQVCAPAGEAAANVDPLRVPAWNKLNTSVYAFVRGLRGMAQSPLVQLLAIGTMAVCMLLLGTTTLIFQNAKRVAHDLGVDKPVTVYMAPGVDAQTAAGLREQIAALPEVESATRVSPDEALERLQDGLGTGETSTVDRGDLLAGLDASLLPESVEVALVPGVEPGFADALAGRVQTMDGVEEVSVLGPWVQEVERMLSTLRWLAFGVAGLVSLACLAIVWSTIRLGVFARRSEIQILRLVGGTHRFVRGPFVVEGVVQGVLGTALALAGLWLAFDLVKPFLERGMSLLFAAGSLRFFSTLELGLALGFGALLGLIGSRAAVARYAEG